MDQQHITGRDVDVSRTPRESVPAFTSVPATTVIDEPNLEKTATVAEGTKPVTHLSISTHTDTQDKRTTSTTQVLPESPEGKEEIEVSTVTKSLAATDLITDIQSLQDSPEKNNGSKVLVATDSPSATEPTSTTQPSQELSEESTGIKALAVTESPSPAAGSVFDTSSNPSLSPEPQTSSQPNTTLSAPSSTQFRGTREVLTIMSPIQEEESAECSVTSEEGSQISATDTNSIIQQERSTTPFPPLTIDVTSHYFHIPRQPVSPSTSQRAADIINGRVSANSRESPLAGRSSQPGQMIAELLSSPPLFSYNRPHEMTNCWLESCGNPTVSSDVQTVTCPRCNDHSYVRYCSSAHLLANLREHYINHCGRRTNLLAIDESTMKPVRTPVRPFIAVDQEVHDSTERHRQALYHAYPPESETATESSPPLPSYYIFTDADLFEATGLPVTVSNLYAYRCTGTVAGRVQYQQTDIRRELFVTLLERLLVLGVSAGSAKPAGCRMLFVWIKENLVDQGLWSEVMVTRVCLAMQLEFGWRVSVELRE